MPKDLISFLLYVMNIEAMMMEGKSA